MIFDILSGLLALAIAALLVGLVLQLSSKIVCNAAAAGSSARLSSSYLIRAASPPLALPLRSPLDRAVQATNQEADEVAGTDANGDDHPMATSPAATNRAYAAVANRI